MAKEKEKKALLKGKKSVAEALFVSDTGSKPGPEGRTKKRISVDTTGPPAKNERKPSGASSAPHKPSLVPSPSQAHRPSLAASVQPRKPSGASSNPPRKLYPTELEEGRPESFTSGEVPPAPKRKGRKGSGEIGGEGDSPAVTSGSGTTTTSSSEGGTWPGRKSVDTSSPSYIRKLEKFNELVATQALDEDDMSHVYELRRYHSEPTFSRDLEERIELRPGSPLPEKCPSMEDLVLSHFGYPELMRGNLVDVDSRQYDVSADMMAEWRGLVEMERTRFSFFDELYAGGYVVDSMEVPARKEDVKYLVEAQPADFRSKVDYGRVVFKTKHVYTGNMKDWYFEGEGRYSWIDGTTYQGEFRNGVMNGDGVILWVDGSIYQGEFTNGIRNGYGIYSTAEGYTYAGDWFQGLPSGKGRMWYDPRNDDSDFYDGEWKQCVPHGFGTRQYSDGDRYVGHFRKGLRSGHGTMIWLKERQVYTGEWRDGVPQGTGTHTWYLPRTGGSDFPTRHVYKGEWLDGMRHGVGRNIYACGSIYEGQWSKGQRHGKGIFVNPAGEVIFGLFRYGSIVGGADVPLHAPTYACRFDSLVLTLGKSVFITPGTESLQEAGLSETVTRYLPQLRRLFKRAGYLGEWWGNQGHYPKWMTKAQESTHKKSPIIEAQFQFQHRNLQDAEFHDTHVHGHKAHRGSPDNVHPLTRFGLWLLMRDCPGLLDDVTLAEFDRAWNSVQSISFQTKHNPFEPVYLYQFLQCLVIVASVIFVEIPKRKEKRKKEEDKPAELNLPIVSPVESPTTIWNSETRLAWELAEEEAAEEEEEVKASEEVPPPAAPVESKLKTKAGKGAKGHRVPLWERKTPPPPKAKPPPTPPPSLKSKPKVPPKKGPPKPKVEPPAPIPKEVPGEDAGEGAGAEEESDWLIGPESSIDFEGEGEEEKRKLSGAEEPGKRKGSAGEDPGKRKGSAKEEPGKRKSSTSKVEAGNRKSSAEPDVTEKDGNDRRKSKERIKTAGKKSKTKAVSQSGAEEAGEDPNPEPDLLATGKKAKLNRNKSKFQSSKADGKKSKTKATPEPEPEPQAPAPEEEEGEDSGPIPEPAQVPEATKAEPELTSTGPGETKRKSKAGSVSGKSKSSLKSGPGAKRTKSKNSVKKKSASGAGAKGEGDQGQGEGEGPRSSSKPDFTSEVRGEEEEGGEWAGEGLEEGEWEEIETLHAPPQHPSFWSESEVQLNTEERMFGWTSAHKDKCKRKKSLAAKMAAAAAAAQATIPGQFDVKIGELFERLLTELLIPCLDRAPGVFLPEVPDPLPPLADLYFSFSKTYDNKEVINAMEFTQSVLPHLLYPHKSEAIFWTRSRDVKTPQVDLDWVFAFFKQDNTRLEGEETFLGEEFLGDKLANTTIFSEELKEEARASFSEAKKRAGSICILGDGNTIFGDEPKPLAKPAEAPENEEPGPEAEEFPFSERDIAPEPFLWDRDPKCLHVPKKEAAFHNLHSGDIMKVLRYLYPSIIGRASETNMGFPMTFCDWLWAISLVAKESADRAFYASMKHTSTIEHSHRKHHHPNHFGLHHNPPHSKSRVDNGLFRFQNTMADLREKYTKSDLHRAMSPSFLQTGNAVDLEMEESL